MLKWFCRRFGFKTYDMRKYDPSRVDSSSLSPFYYTIVLGSVRDDKYNAEGQSVGPDDKEGVETL